MALRLSLVLCLNMRTKQNIAVASIPTGTTMPMTIFQVPEPLERRYTYHREGR